MKQDKLLSTIVRRVGLKWPSPQQLSRETGRTLEIESLEPRILFSGAPAPAPAPAPEPAPSTQEAPAPAPAEVPPSELAIPVAATPATAAGDEIPVADSTTPDVPAPDFTLSEAELAAVVETATQRWAESGVSGVDLDILRNVSYDVIDLPPNQIGKADGTTISIDVDAGGYGWFVDSTPELDEEFFSTEGGPLTADKNSPASGKLDLLTVVLHEQGHILGLPDAASPDSLMTGFLEAGERRLPIYGDADSAVPGSVTGSAYMTTLTAGDIVIIGVQTDNPDTFRFVPLVDLAAGTEITFTDSGILGSGDIRANEGAVKFTAAGNVTAGTNIEFSGFGGEWTAANDANVGTSGFNLSASGDQVIAFVGDSATPTFIYAVQTNSTEWQTGSDDANQSDLPPGLIEGETAVAVGAGSGAESEFDNAYYSGTVTSGSPAEIRGAVSNAANWTGDNSGFSPITSDFSVSNTPQLIISEVVDATLSGGLPKFVELTNMGSAAIDLSNYSIGNFNNGGTTLGGGASTTLSGTLAPGDSYVISYEFSDSSGNGSFFDTYSFDPDNFDLGAFINGDDVVALFEGVATGDGSDATLIDVYGVIGTGSGEPWNYTDGYAYRDPSITAPNGTFTLAEWVIGGVNSLETGNDTTEEALIQSLTTPGVHPPMVPAPEIVINEIMQNPSAVGDTSGEWLELYNAGAADVDIEGWTIRDEGSDSHTITNGGPLIIPSGGYIVLGINSDIVTNGGVTVDYEYSGFTLANGDDEIVLEDTGNVEIDRVEYDGGPQFPDPNGASMALVDVTLDNNVGANWATSTVTFGSGDLGTPGAENFPPAPSPIVISEIMFNPSSSEDDWEWVEIYNSGSSTVDLSGWVIDDSNSVAHSGANIATGSVAAGETAVLFNADDVSAADFEAAWGTGINLIPVTGWSAMGLNNGGDTVGFWDSFSSYSGDNVTQALAQVTVDYPNADDGSGSIFLTNLGDQNSWSLSTDGLASPAGGDAYTSLAGGGNSGADIGSPGGVFAPEISVIGINTEEISSGDESSSPLDGTDFGSADVLTGGIVSRTFTIENTGGGDLTLGATAVTIGGADADAFTVNSQPSETVAGGSTTTFEITFDPSRAGRHDATISISNDDSDEAPYTFVIEANGTIFRDLSATPDYSTQFTAISGLGAGDGLTGAEISAFDPSSQQLFVTSGDGVQVIDLSDPTNPNIITTLAPTTSGATGDEVTSVAVNGAGLLAVAVPGADITLPGSVFFYTAATGAFEGSVTVGALPDMVTFSPDRNLVLVANEGEPDGTDPDGSISIIDVSGGVTGATVQTADFTSFNGSEDDLRASGVKIQPGNSVSVDLEPEYIAVSPDGTTAWVTLQENNAIAIVDIATATVTEILPLGLSDFSMPFNTIDPSDDDGGYNPASLPIFGMYQPDAITSYETGGQTYYITANEGDARDAEETEIEDETLDPTLFPNASFQDDVEAGKLDITDIFGDVDGDGDFDKLHAFGGRSFSIYDATGELVFDSGDLLARATEAAGLYPDGRSDAKGTEPEGVTVGFSNGEWLAFVGLERANAVAVFNVTDPTDVSLVQMLNTDGDVSPEGLVFIPAVDSPTGNDLLVVSNEVSSTIRIYSVAETGVNVNADGDLVIEDISDSTTDDDLSIKTDGTNIIITDPNQILGTNVGSASRPNLGSVVIPLADFDDLIIRTNGGDDTVDLSAMDGFTGGISADGGAGFDEIGTFRTMATLDDDKSLDLDAEKVQLTLSEITVGGTGFIDINATTNSDTGGGAPGTYNGVWLFGSDLKAEDTATVTIKGEGGASGTQNNGIKLTGGSDIATGNGDIDIDGTGGGDALFGTGVALHHGSSVSAGGSGNLTIDGTAGNGISFNEGVFLSTGTSATVENGDLIIAGTASGTGSQNQGIDASGTTLEATGSGSITLAGTASGTGSNNEGLVASSTTIAAVGGKITISGTGGAGTSNNRGIRLASTDITTGEDGVEIDGTGGGSGTGSNNTGVQLVNTDVETTSTGNVEIDGTGGDGLTFNEGVQLTAGSTIKTDSGSATIRGTGAGTSTGNRGVNLSGSRVESTGGGGIELFGTGSAASTGVLNDGIALANSIASTTGTLTMKGIGGGGSLLNSGVKVTGGALSGTLDIAGTGGGGSSPTGSNNAGVYLLNSNLTDSLAGSTIIGTGGFGSGLNLGAYLQGSLWGALTTSNVTTDPDEPEKKGGSFFSLLPLLPLLATGAKTNSQPKRQRNKVDRFLLRNTENEEPGRFKMDAGDETNNARLFAELEESNPSWETGKSRSRISGCPYAFSKAFGLF